MRRNNHVKTGRRDPKVPLLEKSWYTQVSLRWTVGLEHRERGERKKSFGKIYLEVAVAKSLLPLKEGLEAASFPQA